MAYNIPNYFFQPHNNPASPISNQYSMRPPVHIQQFIYSVQCALYKYSNMTSEWDLICQSRNCVIQLYRRDGINVVATSNKSSGMKYFEYPINDLLISKLDDSKNLYQLQSRYRKDEIWGVSFLIRNDGMNFEYKFEDLFQYHQPQGLTNQDSLDQRLMPPKDIKEENICLTTEELTSLIRPLQSAIANGNFASSSNLLKLLCRLPESHRNFTFEPNSEMNEKYSPRLLAVSVECMDEDFVVRFNIEVDPDITINVLKELFYLKYNILREKQKWIIGNKLLLGKDSIREYKELCLCVMTTDVHQLESLKQDSIHYSMENLSLYYPNGANTPAY